MNLPETTLTTSCSNHASRKNLFDSQSTLSTVECNMSFSSVEDGSVHSNRRRRLRKAKSADTLTPVSSKPKSRRSKLRKAKSVEFACDEDGHIKPQERQFNVYLDRSLWWNRQDLLRIQDECWDIVDSVMAGTDGKYSKQDLRGLERFVVDDRDETAEGYRQLVLGSVQGLQFSDEKVREVTRQVAREAQKFARLTAKLDTREAIKAAMT